MFDCNLNGNTFPHLGSCMCLLPAVSIQETKEFGGFLWELWSQTYLGSNPDAVLKLCNGDIDFHHIRCGYGLTR